jgi:hypothetical protein
MNWITRSIAGAVALGLVTAAGGALAVQGNAVVDSKKVAENTVVLGGTVYRVSDSTTIADENGNAITLAEVPTLEQGADQNDAAVWYEASDAEVGTPVLHLLKLTGSVPQ